MTTCTTISEKVINTLGKYKEVNCKMALISGDTAVTCTTGLKRIESYEVSPTSVNAKTVTRGTVAGGVISLVVTDPLADEYLWITAYGL